MDASAEGPMSGIRILDLSAVVAGPFATMMLADQGAEVVKVEPPHGGDHGRHIGPGFDGFGALFAACNRNKKSLVVDLATPQGVAVVHRLAGQVDVVVQNFRPGVATRLGVGYEAIRAINPEIVYASISGFGSDGPYAGQRAYDSVIQALSGIADSQSSSARPPALVSSLICDKVAGLTVAQAISAALFARSRGRGGRHIHVSLLGANLAFNWPDVMWNHTLLAPDFIPGAPLSETYRLWRTRDGYIAVVFIADGAFRGWSRALSAGPAIEAEVFDSLKSQRARWEELVPLWEERIAALTTDEALKRFHAQSVPAGRVRRRDDIADDPQIRHNGSIVEIADSGRGAMRMAAPGSRFEGFEPPRPQRAPNLGEHTAEVLAAFAFNAGEVRDLLDAGVARQA